MTITGVWVGLNPKFFTGNFETGKLCIYFWPVPGPKFGYCCTALSTISGLFTAIYISVSFLK